METFQYYKRGKGELNTNNFFEILKQGSIVVDTLDEKTFVSLLALNTYMKTSFVTNKLQVYVKGYVAHMRGDKDHFSVSYLYNMLDAMQINCENIQHETTTKIHSAIISNRRILEDVKNLSLWFTHFIGADSSVPKFFPSIDSYATKVRKDGKVESLNYTINFPDTIKRVVIVDDILGGGATVQMLVDTLREQGYKGEIYLWVAYNEGFHSQEFIDQFDGVYLGDKI